MHDDITDIADFYGSTIESERERLDRHQLEHELTWCWLDQHLPPEGTLLEIGSATGRYTLELAQRGYHVTAVDFSPELLQVCQQTIASAGLSHQVQHILADARDLTPVTKKDYDAVLLMGPLYHLVLETDRVLALQQAYARLRPGGVIFTAFISRFGILGDLLKNLPHWIEDRPHVAAFLEQGKRPEGAPPGGFRGYFARVPEIIPLHETAGFETITLAAVEPAISADDESYNQLTGDQRRLWRDLLYAVSTEPSTLGASRHLLYIGRKPAP